MISILEKLRNYILYLFYRFRYRGLLNAMYIPKASIVGRTSIGRPLKVYSGDTLSIGLEEKGDYEKYLCKLFEYTSTYNKEVLEELINKNNDLISLYKIVFHGTDKDGRILITMKHLITDENIGETMQQKTKKNDGDFVIQSPLCFSDETTKQLHLPYS